MGTIRRLAVALGLTTASWAMTAPVHAEPSEPASAEGKEPGDQAKAKKRSRKETLEARRETRKNFRAKKGKHKAERVEQRQERLERTAKKLRERAASLREKAQTAPSAEGKVGKEAKGSKERLLERADKFEAQAKRMDERAANLPALEAGSAKNRIKTPEAARRRRQAVRRAHLRRRWGKALLTQDSASELKVHAQRSAKLKRLEELAKKAKKAPAAERAAKLLAQEEERHERRMTAIVASMPKEATPDEASKADDSAKEKSE